MKDMGKRGYLHQVRIKGKSLDLPNFFPDATRGVVRSLDSYDLKKVGVEGVVVNTYHLLSHPGSLLLKKFGGVKKFMNWDGWVISDSGGFQVLSMIFRDKKMGRIEKEGVRFYLDTFNRQKPYLLTPEKSIQVQFRIGADMMVCLDFFTPPGADKDLTRQSVDTTIEWAKRCKEEFERQIRIRGLDDDNRPLLFGVIQGGNDYKERERCARELIKIGFDGFGLGGWPVDETGKVDYEFLQVDASLMPDGKLKYALGIGNPTAVVEAVKMGFNLFDCVLPTRDARHQRLYKFKKDPKEVNWFGEDNTVEFVQIKKEVYKDKFGPIDKNCDCYTCQNYTLAYLYHLFKIKDVLAWRLATIHNLRVYTRLIDELRRRV